VGMDQVITKPFTPTQLAEALRGAGRWRLGR
jgi:CheY-like chemotaxis protein